MPISLVSRITYTAQSITQPPLPDTTTELARQQNAIGAIRLQVQQRPATPTLAEVSTKYQNVTTTASNTSHIDTRG